MRIIDADALPRHGQRGGLVHWKDIENAPTIDAVEVVRCRDCIHYDPPHVENNGERIEYADLPKEAFDELVAGLVSIAYGINVGGRCTVDYNVGYAEDKRVFRIEGDYCRKGVRHRERKESE